MTSSSSGISALLRCISFTSLIILQTYFSWLFLVEDPYYKGQRSGTVEKAQRGAQTATSNY